MRKIQKLLRLDDDTFASFMAGLAGGVTLVVGIYLLHQWGYIG